MPPRAEGSAPKPPAGVHGTRRPRVAASCVGFHWLRAAPHTCPPWARQRARTAAAPCLPHPPFRGRSGVLPAPRRSARGTASLRRQRRTGPRRGPRLSPGCQPTGRACAARGRGLTARCSLRSLDKGTPGSAAASGPVSAAGASRHEARWHAAVAHLLGCPRRRAGLPGVLFIRRVGGSPPTPPTKRRYAPGGRAARAGSSPKRLPLLRAPPH